MPGSVPRSGRPRQWPAVIGFRAAVTTCSPVGHAHARFAGMDRTESGLQWMRRLTQWTLASVAGLVVLIPAADLFARDDLASWAVPAALVALAFVGYVQTRLLLGGMAGLHDATRSWPVVGAAAAVGLALWGA